MEIKVSAARKPRKKNAKTVTSKEHYIGEYLPVDRFELVETRKDEDPIYVAISGDEKLPIPPVFSCMCKKAVGVVLRKEEMPGLFSNNENRPYIWVPVMYDVRRTGTDRTDGTEE